jgi:hypothetical protein
MFGWHRGGENKHLARIEALEKAIEGHNSALKVIRIEWEDVFDRMNRVMGRLNARIRKSEGLQAPESDTQASPQAEMPFGQPTGTHAMLDAMRSRRR